MRRTVLLAVLLAASTAAFAEDGMGPQRLGIYARLVATDPGGSSVMVERADGALWVFRVDAAAMGELAALKSGDEVMLTFVNDGPGTNEDDLVRDVELLASPMRAGFPLPFGVRSGLVLREAAYLRASAIRPRETMSATGVDADFAVPGPVVLDAEGGAFATTGVAAGGVVGSGFGVTTADGLLPGLTTPGPVLAGGRNLVAGTDRFASAVPGTFAQTQPVGSFTPGNVAPNMENPGAVGTGDALSRPAADTPFTPGVVVPGVRDAAAGRGGTRGTQPSVETGFTPGTVAPGVRDTRAGAAGGLRPGETLSTTGVPANLVAPTNVNTATGAATGTLGAGQATGTTGTAQTGVVTGGGAPVVGATAPATVPVTPTGHGTATTGTAAGVPTGHTGGSTTLTPGARSTTGTSGVSGTATGTTTGGVSGGGSNR
jgi:hypothetical protein